MLVDLPGELQWLVAREVHHREVCGKFVEKPLFGCHESNFFFMVRPEIFALE